MPSLIVFLSAMGIIMIVVVKWVKWEIKARLAKREERKEPLKG